MRVTGKAKFRVGLVHEDSPLITVTPHQYSIREGDFILVNDELFIHYYPLRGCFQIFKLGAVEIGAPADITIVGGEIELDMAIFKYADEVKEAVNTFLNNK